LAIGQTVAHRVGQCVESVVGEAQSELGVQFGVTPLRPPLGDLATAAGDLVAHGCHPARL
jgi:hypothetical protein